MLRRYLRRVLGIEQAEDRIYTLFRSLDRINENMLGQTLKQRLDALDKTIREAQSQMIAEAKAWREIAYAVGDKTAIRSEIAKRDSQDVAKIKEKLDA